MRPFALGLFASLVLAPASWAAPPSIAPPPGLRDATPTVHALVGARLVVAPGNVVERGTIVIRDGVIADIGAEIEVPAEARVWDAAGQTIYPGLLDAYGEVALPKTDSAKPAYWNSKVTPHLGADEAYVLDAALNKKLRSQGIAVRLIAPDAGIVKGTSALVTTGDDPARALVQEETALHLRLTPIRGDVRDNYPNSPMGAVALVRQALYDAQWYGQAWEAYRQQTGLPRPEQSEALEALRRLVESGRPVIVDSSNELYFLRADQLGREFGLNVIVRGSGREYRRLEAIQLTERPVIVPLNFPEPPNVKTPEAAMSVSLEELLHWDSAPENPARLAAAGVKFAFTSQGLKDSGKFLDTVRLAVERGLERDEALRALTITPAELFGVADKLGTLEAGKAAHLVVADGELFDKKTKVLQTWVDGHRYEAVPERVVDVRGTWEVTLLAADGQAETLSIELSGEPAKLGGKLVKGEQQTKLESVVLDGAQLGCTLKGEPVGWKGVVQLSATISTEPKAPESWLGRFVWADGTRSPCTGRKLAAEAAKPANPGDEPSPEKPQTNDDPPAAEPPEPSQEQAEPDDQAKPDDPAEPATEPTADEADKATKPRNGRRPRRARFPVNFPLGAFGRSSPLPPQPQAVLFKNATIWTCGPQGVLTGASLLVEAGKITAVGPDVQAPEGALVIDAAGKHLTPGLIDCHSHIATDGGVNESGQTITAEVRIGDFINANDVNIYRQLAGGVTSINILHGSANTIGGQNQVIKLRWGAGPEELKFAGAAPGIKFALGENVKQSNWGERYTTRYPQTRMGVEQLVLDAFRAARHYQKTWEAWRKEPQGIPPRKDLELEALAEVLEGKRLIHCHSYRQDEILAFLRTCAAFQVRVATLQHVLEGYKVADVIAELGVGGSSFSDWWAYKFEVYDAIPYNGALMHGAGVLVSFNSDDAELGRRLNTEAAKAVKYGGVPEEEALKFVTLNPAKQLRIDSRAGSLEPGKDADLVVWNAPPLSTLAVCQQTWIDGRKYFDREDDLRQREQAARMRATLVQRVLASGQSSNGQNGKPDEPSGE